MCETDLQMPNLGLRIKTQLVAHGYTQKDAAGVLGISEATLSNKITGKIKFRAEEIASLAYWLGVPSDGLLGLKPLEVA
ncbi:helix-turn-helix domain-containing protein [Bifidobacterium cebidarum]|uniref:DNA-binding helix-turn-helix protein n=1 Tax=Bifidobacterium cebidarum TaxID=2650773 RepID=A0A6I1GIJ7_9BIFI|nr:helix-turn-helix transcriptional regulator [Bifidobacterium cebidarum]KAB7789446.1 DNA-binding helix-turn-helix protein [Bifidobacterium cebidarum]